MKTFRCRIHTFLFPKKSCAVFPAAGRWAMRWIFSSAICVWTIFFFSGGLISLSFTFVPMLLFNVVKTGFNFVVSAYDTIADLFHFSHEERDMVQYISDQQRREEEKEQAQSAPDPKPVF